MSHSFGDRLVGLERSELKNVVGVVTVVVMHDDDDDDLGVVYQHCGKQVDWRGLVSCLQDNLGARTEADWLGTSGSWH